MQQNNCTLCSRSGSKSCQVKQAKIFNTAGKKIVMLIILQHTKTGNLKFILQNRVSLCSWHLHISAFHPLCNYIPMMIVLLQSKKPYTLLIIFSTKFHQYLPGSSWVKTYGQQTWSPEYVFALWHCPHNA